jgi:hypothetical protein
MENKNFDAKLKAALENIEAPFSPADWSAMEQRLNASATPEAEPAETHAVDRAVYHTLANLEMRYQPADWTRMSARLDQEARRRRRVWITKMAEAAIFLLLLANLDGFLNQINGTSADPTRPQAAVESQNTENRTENRKSAAGRSFMVVAPASMNAGNAEKFALVGQPDGSTLLVPVNGLETPGALTPANATPGQTIVLVGPENGVVAVTPVSALNTGYAYQLLEKTPEVVYAWMTPPTKKARNSDLYVGAFAARDYDFINSAGDARKARQYGGGIQVGLQKGKWGFETGLAYARKGFEPKPELKIISGDASQGYHAAYIARVDADMVAVPLRLTRQVAKMGRFTARLSAGVTAHMAAQKGYRYETLYYPPPGQPGDPIKTPPHGQPAAKGIFEGGRPGGNFYATADVGFRLEAGIGKRATLFVEPVCRKALTEKGIAGGLSQINTVSVQAGVMASL